MTTPQPLIDERGVGWCTSDCQHYEGARCKLIGVYMNGVCIPWARLAAADHAAMELLRNKTIAHVGFSETEKVYWAYAAGSVVSHTANDPADAMRAAAEEKKGGA